MIIYAPNDFNWLKQKIVITKFYFFYVCMYKMVVEITKEPWRKCGIKTLIYHNEEEKINELWHKISDIKTQLGHSNIADVALKRIRKYYSKKTEDITEEEKQKYKAYFKGKEGVFIIEKHARDIIESKLPEAIELRKRLGYNHGGIIVQEETSIAEKIIKLFPNENIVLNKKFNNRKPDIWFKNYNFIIEVDEGNHENYDSDDEKEREDMFKKHNFKIFRCNPNDPNFDLFKFLGKINLHISKLCEKNAANEVVNKIAEDFEKIVTATNSKELKRYIKNILPNYKK